MNDAPDLAEIDAIAQDATSDASAVNRRITHAYHRLSEAARRALDAGPDLDWCGFAKWSSHTVGFNLDPQLTGLRTDEIADQVLALVPGDLAMIRPLVVDLLKAAVDVEDGLVVKALRGGNAMIFREMGSVYVSLLDRFGAQAARDTGSDETFARETIAAMQVAPGRFLEAPIDSSLFTDADEEALVRAILCYLRAARDPAHRSELMLAGNMLFSVYEQTRADRLIAIGTSAPVRARVVGFMRDLMSLDEQSIRHILLAPRGGPTAGSPVVKLVGGVVSAIEEAVAAVLTERALVVEIAGERVRLGRPEDLVPQVVPVLPEVRAVLEAQASGAPENWLDVRYRLAFIARYFAARQRKPGATAEPVLPG